MSLPLPSPATTITFFTALQQLTDPRDNRGKRHELAFVLCGVVLALMTGRTQVSGIHRFLHTRCEWLRELTHAPLTTRCLARAHLPRLLARVDWAALNTLSLTHFGMQVEATAAGEWVAVDGKALRGSPGEQVGLARTHQSGDLLVHQPLAGPKASEIPAVRTLLAQPPLLGRKVTLDAGQCNPTTLAQIQQAQGGDLVQLKANQPTLRTAVHTLATTASPVGTQHSVDKGHGRLEERHATFFSLTDLPLPLRWQACGLRTVIRVARTTEELKPAKRTQAVAYYLTNQEAATPPAQAELFTAIRGHWGCEADHWRRDVIWHEDQMRVTQPTQAHGLGVLRTVALRVFRRAGSLNFRALLDTLADSPHQFAQLLCQVGFL